MNKERRKKLDILGIKMGSEFLDAEVIEHEEDENSEEADS